MLFGEVDQVEVAGEGACDLVGPLDREGLHDRLGPLECFGAGIGVGLNRGGAQALDVIEQAGRAALAEHLAEQSAQHPHVRAHRLRQFLTGVEAPDEIDRFGGCGFGHGFQGSAGVLPVRHAGRRCTASTRGSSGAPG